MNAPLAPAPQRFWNPYLAGVGLGLTLLLSFVTLGTGLGASGAIARGAAQATHVVAPKAVESNGYLGAWFEGGPALRHYLVFIAGGVLVGGFLSGLLAGRVRKTVEKGPRISNGARFALAFLGGSLMGIGAKLARGCASGQALTGGALLSAGGWTFMMLFFAGAYGAAWFVRKEWL